MNCYQIFFSPTGGTRNAADAITANWPQAKPIDLSVPDTDYSAITLEPDALALIALPVFGGVAPQLVLDRLAQIHGNGAKCVLAAVYGNRAYDNTLVQMEDTAVAAGFQVIAAISAVAEHSIFRQYASGRPNAEDVRTLAGFGSRVLEKALSGASDTPTFPGERPYKTSGNNLFPSAFADCTGCGLCAEKCPAQAISPDNFRATDKTRCIGCMRCVAICPAHARSVNSPLLPMAALAIKKACSVPKENELFL